MLRFSLIFALFLCFSVPLFAQTSPIQIEATTESLSLGNGELSVVWTYEKQTIAIRRGDASFASIPLPDGFDAMVVKHPVQGRGGVPVDGASLVVRRNDETKSVESVFTVGDQSPFVLVTRIFAPDMFKDGAVDKLEFPKIELQLPTPGDKLKTLGSAGLRTVDGHKGSYAFLAVADPETRTGVVAVWVTNHRGSGIVLSGKNANGNAELTPLIEYGKLLPPADANNPRENLSEVFAIGYFDDCRRGLERYAWQVARSHRIKLKSLPAGYCTWYADKFGGACNETEIANLTRAAAEKLAPFGFNFVQIDDGWQIGVTKNGPKKDFTQHNTQGPYRRGMRPTAEMIQSYGMMSGLWFMPFSGSSEDSYWDKSWFVKSGVTDELNAEGKSKRRYPQTVNKLGEPYESFWGGTSLDLTNPAVQRYLHDEVERIAKDWGFDYFKLDGLWTGMAIEQLYVNNEYRPDDLGQAIFHDPSITPVAAYRKGLDIIRQAAGDDVFILGCNVSQNMRTLAASYGLVDAMRIGPDNGAKWDSLKQGPWHGSNRYFLNGRVWWNDPDPVYVRDSMPLEHARLIASWVAVSGQLFAFSDWLPTLSEERIEVLRRTIRPHGLRSARPVDLFSEDLPRIWHLTTRSNRPLAQGEKPIPPRDIVAFYNWDEKKAVKIEATPTWIGLPEAKEYVAFDFWGNRLFGTFTDKLSVEVPAGSCLILAVRPVEEHPILLSTSQHVTQGIVDVVEESWDPQAKTLRGVSVTVDGDAYELRIYDPVKKELRRKTFVPADFSGSSDGEFSWAVEF